MGHPILWSRRYFNQLQQLEQPQQLFDLLRDKVANVWELPTDDGVVPVDVG